METARLLLRLVEKHDGFAQWFGVWSDYEVPAWAARQEHGWRVDGAGKWMAYDRGTGELVGRGGLSPADVDGERRLQVGWAVRQKLWGRGYATEIGRAASPWPAVRWGSTRWWRSRRCTTGR